ncbi:ABC transporter transmembrane domain-containing protein, partial [Neptuniibacter sp.]|uniref:ABC transporter permease n=1 Tax=Neptuniibacter sp. TaxID=1962643 RepID=UPI00261A5431
MSEDKKTSVRGMDVYLRLLTYVRPYWVAFMIGIIGFILYAASQTGFAALMEYLVDAINDESSQVYIYGPLALLAIALIRGIGTFTGNYFIAYVARNVVHQLRVAMFQRLLVLPVQFFHENSSGHILSKITFNVEQVTKAATDSLKIAIREGATVLGLLCYLLYLNWQLTMVFAAVSPLIAGVVWYASKRFRRLGHRIQDSMGEVSHVVSENVQGMQIVRMFGGCESERQRFFAASKQNLKQSLKLAATEALSTPIVQFIVSSSLALLIFLSLHPVLNSGMSAGEFIAFITAAGLIAKPLRTLTEVNSVIQRGIAAAESIFDLLDSDAESDLGRDDVERVQGHLQLQNL